MAQTWLNPDGLYRRYGTEEARVKAVGELQSFGPHRVTGAVINLAELSASAQTILSDTVMVPAGAFIEQIEVFVTTVTVGTNSNLDLGFIRMDRATELDYNGLLAAADAWHAATVGTKTIYNVGTTEAGALLGTALANDGLLVAKADTAAFDSGIIEVRVYWSPVRVAGDLV